MLSKGRFVAERPLAQFSKLFEVNDKSSAAQFETETQLEMTLKLNRVIDKHNDYESIHIPSTICQPCDEVVRCRLKYHRGRLETAWKFHHTRHGLAIPIEILCKRHFTNIANMQMGFR